MFYIYIFITTIKLTIFWRFWRPDPFSASAQSPSTSQTSDHWVRVCGEDDAVAHHAHPHIKTISVVESKREQHLAGVAVSFGVAGVGLLNTGVKWSQAHISVNVCGVYVCLSE